MHVIIRRTGGKHLSLFILELHQARASSKDQNGHLLQEQKLADRFLKPREHRRCSAAGRNMVRQDSEILLPVLRP